MHVCELTQLAATVATHAPVLIHHGEPFPSEAVEQYWAMSKCRQENWARALKDFSRGKQDAQDSSPLHASNVQPVLEEVLTSEILSRVWAAICSLADARRGAKETSAIVQNILIGHLEARHRVLSLMVYGYELRVEESVSLNRLRIRNEHWTDTLLALIGPAAGRAEWAFQPERVTQLARSLRQHETAERSDYARSILLATFAVAYQQAANALACHAELNRRIACSIVACLPPHIFDATGQFGSIQQLWLSKSSSDNRGRLDLTKPRPAADSQSSDNSAFSPGRKRFDIS